MQYIFFEIFFGKSLNAGDAKACPEGGSPLFPFCIFLNSGWPTELGGERKTSCVQKPFLQEIKEREREKRAAHRAKKKMREKDCRLLLANGPESGFFPAFVVFFTIFFGESTYVVVMQNIGFSNVNVIHHGINLVGLNSTELWKCDRDGGGDSRVFFPFC